jgi:hypothetical protein
MVAGQADRGVRPFPRVLGMGVVFCRPAIPKAKGLVERANG